MLKNKIQNNLSPKNNEEEKVVNVNSINFIPNIITDVTAVHQKNMSKVYYLSALFSLRLLKSHISSLVQKRINNCTKQILTEFCQNWIFY